MKDFKFLSINKRKQKELSLGEKWTHTIVLFEDIDLKLLDQKLGCTYQICFKQDGVGSRTVKFPPVIWSHDCEPLLNSQPNSMTVVTLYRTQNRIFGDSELYDGTNFEHERLNVTIDSGQI
jgi:hypothetical protein